MSLKSSPHCHPPQRDNPVCKRQVLPRGLALERPREPKVAQLEAPGAPDEQVRALDVPVQNLGVGWLWQWLVVAVAVVVVVAVVGSGCGSGSGW
jgi:hypothetical protein